MKKEVCPLCLGRPMLSRVSGAFVGSASCTNLADVLLKRRPEVSNAVRMRNERMLTGFVCREALEGCDGRRWTRMLVGAAKGEEGSRA